FFAACLRSVPWIAPAPVARPHAVPPRAGGGTPSTRRRFSHQRQSSPTQESRRTAAASAQEPAAPALSAIAPTIFLRAGVESARAIPQSGFAGHGGRAFPGVR